MQKITETFANLSVQDPTLWIILGSLVTTVIFFSWWARRSANRLDFTPFVSATSTSLDWVPPESRNDERRRHLRRPGLPVPVLVFDPSRKRRGLVVGYVLDRSQGGLRLALQQPYPIGTELQVKPEEYAQDCEWVDILVRNSREIGDYYEVGCQFKNEVKTLVLHLFG
jgi:hypothetical protein